MAGCTYEIDVAAAARNGGWTDALQDHAASCLECAETALVVSAFAEDVDGLVSDDSPLPDPRIIWIKSRLKARQEKSFQATRVMAWVQRLTVAGVVVMGMLWSSDLRGLCSGLWSLIPKSAPADVSILVSGPVAVMAITFFVMVLMAVWTERSAEG